MVKTIVLGCLAGGLAAQTIVLETEIVDFGRIYDMRDLSQRVVVTNAGDQPLKIREVRSRCGCAAGVMDDLDIAARGQGMLTVTVRPKGRRGELDGTLLIVSNDPASPARLTVHAKVVSVVTVEPSRLDFRRGPNGYEQSSYVVRLTNSADDPIKITGYSLPNAALTVRNPDPIHLLPGQPHRLDLALDPAYRPDAAELARVIVQVALGEYASQVIIPVLIEPAE